MCTVTWWRGRDGFEVFFNRDELRARKEGRPPRLHETCAADAEAVRFLAPEDGDFGGTWIAANSEGLVVGVLNGYRAADSDPPVRMRSRGLLVTDLASSRSVAELEERLAASPVDRYRSFRLLALDPSCPALVAEWDRRSLEIDADAEARLPLISSSFEETDVGEARRQEFARMVGEHATRERLAAYHRSHTNGPSAYSVCMHRPDATTRSFTHVRVGAKAVSMKHLTGTPCEPVSESELLLPRTEAARQ